METLNCGPVTWLFLLVGLYLVAGERQQYAMYIWVDGYDPDVPGCTEKDFLNWTKSCLTNTWNTTEKRRWLWDTCNRPGKEISTIFLAGIMLQDGYNRDDCTADGVQLVKTTLQEGYQQVPGLQVYALYAVSDMNVTEQFLVKYVVWYNDVCAGDQEKFVGVAVNNEAFNEIRCGTPMEKAAYLQNLDNIRTEASKQANGYLKAHYSMAWSWGYTCENGSDINVMWNGTDKKVTRHMIDIFDSVDVQVAFVVASVMAGRAKMADYDYAVAQRKNFFITLYTCKTEPCQITFFPQPCGFTGNKTEVAMFYEYDQLAKLGVEDAPLCIEYFRGIYSSGGNSDWPRYDSGVPAISGSDPVLADYGPGLYCKCWILWILWLLY
ncbi:uncharacterized protein LOC144872022 [Branchiostoma floridae x Branchiostoma japonicum]